MLASKVIEFLHSPRTAEEVAEKFAEYREGGRLYRCLYHLIATKQVMHDKGLLFYVGA